MGASPLHHRCITVAARGNALTIRISSHGVPGESDVQDEEEEAAEEIMNDPEHAGFDRGAIPKGVVNLFCRRIHISNKLYGFQNR